MMAVVVASPGANLIHPRRVCTTGWSDRTKDSQFPVCQYYHRGGLKRLNGRRKSSTVGDQLQQVLRLTGKSRQLILGLDRATKPLKYGKVKSLSILSATATVSDPINSTKIFPPFVEELHIDSQALPPFRPLFEKTFDSLPLNPHGDAAAEEFITRAHEVAASWLPSNVQTRLENFLHQDSGPSVLIVRGLPVDSDPPPTPYAVGNVSAKPGKTMSEAWVLAVARMIGQPVTYESLVKRGMAGGLVCDLTPNPDSTDKVAFDGCKRVLDLHRDFAVTPEKIVADALLLIGVRGDPRKEAKTTVCDFRALLAATSPADVSILRSEPMRWDGGTATNNSFAIAEKLLITGPDSNPLVNIFEENILPTGAASLKGSPQLLEAYGRVKETARRLAVGVWLDAGDLLIVNNSRAAHGRTAYTAVFDGSDRWVQRVWAKKELVGGLGEPPSRVLRFVS